MRRSTGVSLACKAIAAAVLITPLTARPAHAGQATTCSDRIFRGNYVLTVDGVVYNAYGPSIHGPVTRVGYMHGNGDGTFTVPSLASYAGVPAATPSRQGWQPEDANGVYSIGPDCSLTLTVNAPPPLGIPITFTGSITGDGKHLSFMQSNPVGTTVKATSERIQTPCSVQDITGNWLVDMRGTIMPPIALPLPPPLGTLNIGLPNLFGEYRMVGQFTVAQPSARRVDEWSGEVTARTLVAFGGLFAAIELGPNPSPLPVARMENENWTGTYTIARDCTVNVRYTAMMGGTPVPLSWWGLLKTDGASKELRFIMSELPIGPMLGTAWPRVDSAPPSR
jgi:hypothetical protein